MKENFTKKDLKNLMVVALRNGWKAVVIDDILMGVDGFMRLRNYNDNLKKSDSRDYDYDIMKVWQPTANMGGGFNDYIDYTVAYYPVFWERKEKKEIKLTTEERAFLNSILLVSDYKYIARDKECKAYGNALWVYLDKPVRDICSDRWYPDYKKTPGATDGGKNITEQTKGMFEFITWGDEPYLIEDLLKGDIK